MRTGDLHGSHLLLVYGFALVITARYFMAGKLLHGVLALTFIAALVTVNHRRVRRRQRHDCLSTAKGRDRQGGGRSGDVEN